MAEGGACVSETPSTNMILRNLHPQRFCRSEITRGRFTWQCFQEPGHAGPHKGGNSDNDPTYRTWFDVFDGVKA